MQPRNTAGLDQFNRTPHKVWRFAAFFSLLLTISITIPCLLEANHLYSLSDGFFLTTFHFTLLFLPLSQACKQYFTDGDLLNPWFVASITFAIFHIAFSPVSYCDVQQMSHVRLAEQRPASEILMTYWVLLGCWLAFHFGYLLMGLFTHQRQNIPVITRKTNWYLILGILFIVIGVLGHMQLLGGLGNYVAKMRHFYAYSEIAARSMQSGGTKWRICMTFLPVGIVLLAYGYFIRYPGDYRRLLILLCIGALLNFVLGCSTGGRGRMLLAAFYSVIIWNHALATKQLNQATSKYISPYQLSKIFLFLFGVVFVLGIARGSYSHNTSMQFSSRQLHRIVTHYLSNYNGTLRAVCEVQAEGISNGSTAFAGFTGLLGGATPRKTQDELRESWLVTAEGVNARYGAPSELFYNFGWLGIALGMALFGTIARILKFFYEYANCVQSVAGGLIAVFTAYNANFLLIGNLSTLPPHFIYYSLPFYLVFFFLNRIKC